MNGSCGLTRRLVVKGEWNSPDARLNAAERILTQLAKVALAV